MNESNLPLSGAQSLYSVVVFYSFGHSVIRLVCVVNCWALVSGNETYVNIEYEASEMFDLNNVVISIPLPALREAPTVKQIDGEWNGSMKFIVLPADPSTFFPIPIGFAASNTFSDLKVIGIHPLKEGNHPKYSQRVRLVAANYQIV